MIPVESAALTGADARTEYLKEIEDFRIGVGDALCEGLHAYPQLARSGTRLETAHEQHLGLPCRYTASARRARARFAQSR